MQSTTNSREILLRQSSDYIKTRGFISIIIIIIL